MDWEHIISENMDALEIPGRAPLYKPRGEKGSVWILTDGGEYPSVVPPMDRHDMLPAGGYELDLDASDPDFLVIHKAVGMAEYRHCIPWNRIVDILFFQVRGD